MNLAQPDMIIFRVHEETRDDVFAQILFDEDGQLEETAHLFTVQDGDSYKQLDYDQVVLAEEVEGGSIALSTFSVGDPDDRLTVCEMDITLLRALASDLVDVYNTQGPSSQMIQ